MAVVSIPTLSPGWGFFYRLPSLPFSPPADTSPRHKLSRTRRARWWIITPKSPLTLIVGDIGGPIGIALQVTPTRG